MKYILAVIIILCVSAGTLVAEAPHEHGAARLEIVVTENTVHASLYMPAINVVGFEWAPSNAEEETVVAEAESRLEGNLGVSLVRLIGNRVSFGDPVLRHEEHHEEEHAEETSAAEAHSEFILDYVYEGNRANNLRGLDVSGIFSAYPAIEHVDWVAVLPSGQRAGEAAANSVRINLR